MTQSAQPYSSFESAQAETILQHVETFLKQLFNNYCVQDKRLIFLRSLDNIKVRSLPQRLVRAGQPFTTAELI